VGGIVRALPVRWLDSIWPLSTLLALPGLVMTYRYAVGGAFYGEYLHATGELAARLLIAALAITPLRCALPNTRWVAWLARRRRYIGVGAFGYALLHAAAYLERQPGGTVVREATEIAMAPGWLALLVMLALAVTSNDASVRRLRRGWKWLHRSVYVAAALTFTHWLLAAFDPVSGIMHLGVLAFLEGTRLWLVRAARRRGKTAHAAE
jgi:methionine sulfoxide reductase heme-binding subunit